MAWTRVSSLDDIPAGKPLKADIGGEPAMLAKVAGSVHACSRVCLHRGGDLSQGMLEGAIVTCPLHFWQFDVTTGAGVQVPSAKLKTYPLKTENNEVSADV